MAWAANYRQNWIADRLVSPGFVNRKNLSDQFGISTAQASIDLNRFMRERPGLMTYDKTAKRYVRVSGKFAHAPD